MDKQQFIISSYTNLVAAFQWIKAVGFEKPYVIEVKAFTRTIAQNDLMWSLLGEISKQLVWHGQKLTPENWKDVLTAALKRQAVVPGIDGGFVVLGQRTSKMTVKEMNEVIELAYAFGAQNGVKFKPENN
jgi:hypothetical protein